MTKIYQHLQPLNSLEPLVNLRIEAINGIAYIVAPGLREKIVVPEGFPVGITATQQGEAVLVEMTRL